jgi:hypothetical protein
MEKTCKHCGALFQADAAKRMYCGRSCSAKISRNKRHGLSGSREHATWLDMRNRCRNPKCHNYARYGGRGINICSRWEVFENFLADMGPKPGRGYSIERKNNDADYGPENCRWATQAEQNRNKSNLYTTAQDLKIREAVTRGYTFRQMSVFVGKSIGSVTMRTYRLGLRSGISPQTERREREYEPDMNPVDDAEFGMKP